MTQLPRGVLYALYLQATRATSSGKTQRRQWIVLPPLPSELAEKANLDHARSDYLSFYREQATLENRVKWRSTWYKEEDVTRVLPDAVLHLMKENVDAPNAWSISPVITAQMTPGELSALQKNPMTPYALLRRFEKVAGKVHGLSI